MGQKSKFKFTKLTPTKNAEISGYEEALKYAFDNSENSDIRNIALSGPYGSGKSSVIKTFAEENDKNLIYVSLAHFADGKEEDKSDIEKKIVNSLVQQIPKRQVPDSKFHIKDDTKVFAKRVTALFLGIAAFTIYLSKIIEIKKFFEYFVGNNIAYWLILIVGSVLFVCAAISFSLLIYKLVRWQGQDRLIAKIKHNGDEVEFKEDGPSYFDRHLDEILYLLVNAECDGFVFEDLDRFSASKVKLFEHLREICELANLRLQSQGMNRKVKRINDDKKKTIRFFYLVSDATFATEERTKFFDFIIPIIPVVDTCNSYIFLKKYLEESFGDNYNDKFLRGLSFFLEDMRIVKNIINEYLIYEYRNNAIYRDATQLLAVIVYKNVFPEDFADLQVDKGYVYSIFNKKEILRESKIKDIQAEIEALTRAKNEFCESIKELEAVRCDRERNPLNYHKNYNIWLREDYIIRKDAIERKISNSFIDKDLSEYNRAMLHVNSKKLAELIDDKNRDDLYEIEINGTSLKSLPQYPLICYLIEGGYLDEDTYRDCISVFYEGGISANDWSYVSAVKSSKTVDVNQSLNDVAKVFEYLASADFLKKSTKNYALLNYIFKEEKRDCIDSFVLQLKDNNDIKFVEEFYIHSEIRELFIKNVVEKWDNALTRLIDSVYAQKSNEISVDVVQRIVLSAISNSSSEYILNNNASVVLTQYLSDGIDSLICNDDDVSKVIGVFQELGVEIEDLEKQICEGKLFDEVYNANLYALNSKNISTILAKKYGKRIGDRYNTLLTLIYSNKTQPLYGYVQSNLEDVVNLVLENTDQIEDCESTAISVLNSDLSDDTVKKYINAMKNRISDITSIDNEKLWKELIDAAVVKASVYNIISFFQKYGLTDALVMIINNSLEEIEFKDFSDDVKADFWEKSYCNNSYSFLAYQKMCESIGTVVNNFNASGLASEKIKCLLANKLIQVNANNLNVFRSNYKEYVVDYICTDIDRYIHIIQPNTFNMNETLGILDNPSISYKEKIALLKRAQHVKVPLIGKQYDEELTLYILKNHFDSTELGKLFEKYAAFSPDVRDEIYAHVKTSVNVLVACSSLPEILLERLFEDRDFSQEDKITVFDSILSKIDKDTAAKLLILSGETNIAKVFQENKRLSSIPNDNYHKELLEVLRYHNYIEGYEDIGNGFKIKKISKPKKEDFNYKAFDEILAYK